MGKVHVCVCVVFVVFESKEKKKRSETGIILYITVEYRNVGCLSQNLLICKYPVNILVVTDMPNALLCDTSVTSLMTVLFYKLLSYPGEL